MMENKLDSLISTNYCIIKKPLLPKKRSILKLFINLTYMVGLTDKKIFCVLRTRTDVFLAPWLCQGGISMKRGI